MRYAAYERVDAQVDELLGDDAETEYLGQVRRCGHRLMPAILAATLASPSGLSGNGPRHRVDCF